MSEWLHGSWAQRVTLLCWAVFFLYWAIAAFRTKRVVERSGGWWQRVLVLAVVVFVVSRSRLGGGVLNTRVWLPSTLTGVIGVLLLVGGLALALRARAVLGGNWSGTVTIKAEHELIQRGPYHYVRHPIYSAILLMMLGTAVADGRALWFVGAALCLAGFTVKARSEEQLLTKHFPDAYPEYRRRVKAIIPFVL